METSGPWFDIDGVGGTLTHLDAGLLVVRQTEAVHQEIAEILDGLREKVVLFRDSDKPAVDPDSVETEVYQILDPGGDPREVLAAVRKYVAPESWEGPQAGELSLIGHALVVRHRHEVQQRVKSFVIKLNSTVPLSDAELENALQQAQQSRSSPPAVRANISPSGIPSQQR
ncbi:MAG: hypothetical protein WD069_12135 [Planctomycetales bacterium]